MTPGGSPVLVDGQGIAAQLLTDVGRRASLLREHGVRPKLAIVTVGDSKPTQLYVRRLQRLGEPAGIDVVHRPLDADVTVGTFEDEVAALDSDATVDGILVQMPLPEGLAEADLSSIVDPRKDIDGITIENAGRLYLGLPGHRPSTAAAMIYILDVQGVEIPGKRAVVVGRSKVVGHPMAELLLHRHATVTITHRQTREFTSVTRTAEILVVAAGRPGLITPEMISPGVILLDAGISVENGKVIGDARPECAEVASLMTPVPGGVGPVTNAVLLQGVVESAEQRGG